MLRIILSLWLAITPAVAFAQQSGLLLGVSSTAAVSKGYTYIGGNDFETNSTATTATYPVTMTGTAGRLIFIAFSASPTITSAVYDPTGANVTLNADFSGTCAGQPCAIFSANVPSASGSKNVVVTYGSNIAFNFLSGIGWLATGLTSGFDSATGSSATITINTGDFAFGAQYKTAGGMTDGWVANSSQTPTAHRLSSTSLSGGTQNSTSADWSSPTPTSLTAFSAAGNPLLLATYK